MLDLQACAGQVHRNLMASSLSRAHYDSKTAQQKQQHAAYAKGSPRARGGGVGMAKGQDAGSARRMLASWASPLAARTAAPKRSKGSSWSPRAIALAEKKASLHAKRQAACLKALHSLLRKLPRERRHCVLATRLSEEQRRALERWMQEQKKAAAADAATKAAQQEAKEMDGKKCLTSRKRKGDALQSATTRRPHSSIASVSPRGSNNRYHYAYAWLDGLELLSRREKDLERVQHFRQALLVIKTRFLALSSTAEAASSVESTLSQAISEGLAACDLTAQEVGLSFKVVVRTLWINHPIRTRAYNAVTELESGLRTWRRLRGASGSVAQRGRKHVLKAKAPDVLEDEWRHFKEEFAAVLRESFHPRAPVVQRRLQELEEVRSQEFAKQMEIWNLSTMRLEEKRQREHEWKVEQEKWLKAFGEDYKVAQRAAEEAAAAQVEKRIAAVLLRWARCGPTSAKALAQRAHSQ